MQEWEKGPDDSRRNIRDSCAFPGYSGDHSPDSAPPFLGTEPKSVHLMTARQMATSGPRLESADSLLQVSPGY